MLQAYASHVRYRRVHAAVVNAEQFGAPDQQAAAGKAWEAALRLAQEVFGEQHPITAEVANRAGWAHYRPGAYARAEPLLQRALAIREKALGSKHPDTASSLDDLAGLYIEMADYGKAKPLLERALAIREQVLGPEHPDTASSLRNLAGMYLDLDAYAKAEPLYQRALAIHEKVRGPEHLDTAASLNSLALLYFSMGAYAQAEPLYQRALAIREKLVGPEHPDTATSLNSLAAVYNQMGDYAKAEPLCQRALSIHEKVRGLEHPDTANSLSGLAALYKKMGDYAKAAPLYQRALVIYEKVRGPEHPDTARSLSNLAGLYYTMGVYAKAEPLYQRALGIREKVLGPEHRDTATSLANLAALYEATGAYSKAEPLYQRALAINEKMLGGEHLDTASSLIDLAWLYETVGAYAKAEPLFQRALAIHEKVLGLEHPATAGSLYDLAGLYDTMGAYAKAEPLYQRALATYEKARGPEHPDTARTLSNLAGLYRAMGEYAKAEPLYQRALAINETEDGPEHPDTARSLSNLAVLYYAMGAYARAEPLLQRALAINEKVVGPAHPATAASLNNLALLYANMGAFAKAEPLYQRALAINEKLLGPEHPATAVSMTNLAELYLAMSAYTKAEPLYQRALAIREKVFGPEHPDTAASLNNLARLFDGMGDYANAEQLFLRSQQALFASDDTASLSTVTANLAALQWKQGRPDLAILLGKQAVAFSERERRRLRDIDRSLERAYIGSKDSIYRELAGWLMAAGRIGEGERVLELLRVEELRDFARGAEVTRQSLPPSQVRLCVGRECDDQDEFNRIGARRGAIERELVAFQQNPEQFSPERKSELLAERNMQSARFRQWLVRLVERYGEKLDPELTRSRIEEWKTSASALRTKTLSALPSGTVALRYFMTKEVLYLMVFTENTQDFREISISDAELSTLVGQLRAAILQRRDTQPAAQALYAKLIAPVRSFLDEATLDVDQPVLMIAPHMALGMLPFAALHDGGQFLVERYALALFSDLAPHNLKDKPSSPRQRSFGVTQAVGDVPALPAVASELASLAQAVPGDAPLLDGDFTEAKLRDTFELNRQKPGSYPIVHIASHFNFYPGNTLDSGLQLGGGAKLSLDELMNFGFTNTELLTLSACQTAETGGIPTDNGLTVDGIGPLAQINGAHAVLATLWSVNDASTGELMKKFYQKRYDPKQPMNKAQALRLAQLAMIRGGDAQATSEGLRAGSSGGTLGAKAAQQPVDPQRPHAHPFFWAPFVLMGNWL
jgi:CHAT domain-containing protein/Tfp pilus assembly protein PilF